MKEIIFLKQLLPKYIQMVLYSDYCFPNEPVPVVALLLSVLYTGFCTYEAVSLLKCSNVYHQRIILYSKIPVR